MPPVEPRDPQRRAPAPGAGGSAERPSEPSRWRLAIFSLLVTGAFFLALEAALALAGIRSLRDERDPYVGFSSRIPLFVKGRGDDGRGLRVTAPNKLPWFNAQRFATPKPPGTYRIFCLGGSTTFGRPYDHRTSFCGWLAALLDAADGSRRWEVVNAGGISYASYRVALLMEELVGYEPDLFVIYTGQNEFLEQRTYPSMIQVPSSLRGLAGLLSATRTYSALQRLIRAARPRGDGTSRRDELPGEVQTLLDESAGLERYTRDDVFRERVVAHFRFNLERMVDTARAAGARLILVGPASNLADCSPFKSEHRADLSALARERWRSLVERAEAELRAGRRERALVALDEATATDERHAYGHYLRGRVLDRLGRHADARRAFVRARDEDVCPLRAISSLGAAVAEVAARKRVPFVDFAALVDARSAPGIPGADLFLDHVHPTLEGHRMLALALLDELVTLGVARPEAGWGESAIRRVSEEVESRVDPSAHGVALRNLAQVLLWAGKREEAGRLALEALAEMPDDALTHYLAALEYQRRGDREEARAHLERSLAIDPEFPRAHYNLGLLLATQGGLEAARGHFQRALEIDPEYAAAHGNLGKVLEELGDLEGARSHYEQAIRHRPDLAVVHVNLGELLMRQGRTREAAASFERALRLDPTDEAARERLRAARSLVDAAD
jgi:tetratricopeptide (TPR) repeat protein